MTYFGVVGPRLLGPPGDLPLKLAGVRARRHNLWLFYLNALGRHLVEVAQGFLDGDLRFGRLRKNGLL